MRILRGNVPRETILTSLTSHACRHIDRLCDVLTIELDGCSLFLRYVISSTPSTWLNTRIRSTC